jgi:hypothetical protein
MEDPEAGRRAFTDEELRKLVARSVRPVFPIDLFVKWLCD